MEIYNFERKKNIKEMWLLIDEMRTIIDGIVKSRTDKTAVCLKAA